MLVTNSWNEPGQIGASTAAFSVLTSATDILTISDGGHMKKSQITLFIKCDLTSATSCKFRVLHSPDGGTTYIATPIINTVTGVAVDVPIVINTTSYNISGNLYGAVVDIPLSGTTQFKIQGTAAGATCPTTLWVYGRDN